MNLPDEYRAALQSFIQSPQGIGILAFCRANPPPAPNADGTEMQPHHVQINYGFEKGLKAQLDQLVKLAAPKPLPEDPPSPTLHDTRSL